MSRVAGCTDDEVDGMVNGAGCTVPPTGWKCTRVPGHEGPCAAITAPLKPEHVHASHEVCDDGYIISDPTCVKCGATVYDTPQLLKQPCAAIPNTGVFIDDQSPPGSWAAHIATMEALKPRPKPSLAERVKRACEAALREFRR